MKTTLKQHQVKTGHVQLKGTTTPRLPHERDESDDSQQGMHEEMKQAYTDLQNGLVDTDLRETSGSEVFLSRGEMMDNNPVGWFEIYVQDMDRAKKFYESVFQVKLERLNAPEIEMWNFPMVRDGWGAAGALVKMEGVPSGGNSTLVYFNCADCAVEASRVAAAGGRIHKEKMSIGEYGFIALAVDTEGNMIGLHSMQ